MLHFNNNQSGDNDQTVKEDAEEDSPSKLILSISNFGGCQSKLIIHLERRLAFLDLLIEASENGEKLSDDDIREEVDTFMFAGHDTTATAMGWFLYCMARNPHEQVKFFIKNDIKFLLLKSTF